LRSSSPVLRLPSSGSESADERTVPAGPGRAAVRERASRFLAFAFPATDAGQAAAEIARLKKEYHDATHVAFAWKIGSGDSAAARSADAGEPPGTAGKPIAAAIEAAGVANVAVAVVRYYGGTKLGTGGLARAYREAASRALAAAGTKTLRETSTVLVTCPYERLGAARKLVRPPGVILAGETFDAGPVLRLEVLPSRLKALLASLDEARLSYEIVRRE
jgi:uncharacterized YigZ family protein